METAKWFKNKQALKMLETILGACVSDEHIENPEFITIKHNVIAIDPNKKVGENILSEEVQESIEVSKMQPVTREDITNGKLPDEIKKGLESGEIKKIPPAWTDVKIAKDLSGNYWCSGVDKKGRLQVQYTPTGKRKAEEKKWKMVRFLLDHTKDLDKEIKRVLKEDKESGLVLRLMRTTGIRVGNNADTKAKKKAYGATTLKGEHIFVDGDEVRLKFVGKDGVNQDILVTDKALKRELLKRRNKEKIFDTSASKLNKIMRDVGKRIGLTEDRLHNHNLRHLLATEMAQAEIKKFLAEHGTGADDKIKKKFTKELLAKVSGQLGNKPKQAEESYILPEVTQKVRVEKKARKK